MTHLEPPQFPRCVSCGAPLSMAMDRESPPRADGRCQGCIHPDGTPLSRDDVIERMARYLVESLDLTPRAAREVAEERINAQPAWAQRRSKKR